MRKLAPALALLLVATALSGCGGGGKTASRASCPAGELCLEYGNTGEPATLDPQKYNATWEASIVQEIIVGLTDQDAAGQTVPGMATHWEQSPDGLTWTFHLRDAQWSDGQPVTAEDFVYGFRRAFSPAVAAAQASQAYFIKNAQAVNEGKAPLTALGVRAPDRKTVVIELGHPWVILPDSLNSPFLSPVPKHVVEKIGDEWLKPGKYVGNGPYLPVSWKLGDRVVIRKNPRYYDAAKVCIDQISFYPTIDAISAERRVLNGELDLNNVIQSNRLRFLREKYPAYIRSAPYIGVVFLNFNLKDVPALKDVRVRQAISMAIDRDFITDKLFQGGQRPAYSNIPPGTVDYNLDIKTYWADWPLEKRQAEARRLLAEAGYGPKNPLKLELKHRNSADPALYVPAVQADMRAIGVDLQLASNEVQIAYAAYDAKDYQIGDAGWAGGIDAIGYLMLQRDMAGTQNNTGFHDDRFEALLKAADNERDIGKRMQLIGEAEKIVLAAAPIAPIYTLSSKSLVNPNVTGWVDNPVDTHKARFLCFKDADARRRRDA
jgi:oligopeptide transport system substrate-binding protein